MKSPVGNAVTSWVVCLGRSVAATGRQEADADRRASRHVDLRGRRAAGGAGQRPAGADQHHGRRSASAHVHRLAAGRRARRLLGRAGHIRRGDLVAPDGDR